MRWVSAGLTGIHRVLGVGIGLLVMLWFGSGAVLLFVPYPSLTEAERFRWLEPLQLERCCVPIESVLSQVGQTQGVEKIRLLMAAGRPVYVIHFLDGTLKSLWADRGESLSGIIALTLYVSRNRVRSLKPKVLQRRWRTINGRSNSGSLPIVPCGKFN